MLTKFKKLIPSEDIGNFNSWEDVLTYCQKNDMLADETTLDIFKRTYTGQDFWIYCLYAKVLQPITIGNLIQVLAVEDLRERVDSVTETLPKRHQEYLTMTYIKKHSVKELMTNLKISRNSLTSLRQVIFRYLRSTPNLLKVSAGSVFAIEFLKEQARELEKEIEELSAETPMTQTEQIYFTQCSKQIEQLLRTKGDNSNIYNELEECHTNLIRLRNLLQNR
jgi:DNA-directed RNA polymerase specialized sigma subunit